MIGVIVIVPPACGLQIDDDTLPWRPLVTDADDVCALARAIAGALPVDEAATAVVVAETAAHARVHEDIIGNLLLDEVEHVLAPGDDLRATLRAALDVLPARVDVVVVQDAQRPLVARGVCDRLVEAARAATAAIPGCAPRGVLVQRHGGDVPSFVDDVRVLQGPVSVQRGVLTAALEADASSLAPHAHDDAASWIVRVLRAAGRSVTLIDGDDDNLLVRTAADASRAVEVLARRAGDLPVLLARDSLPEDPLARPRAAAPTTESV